MDFKKLHLKSHSLLVFLYTGAELWASLAKKTKTGISLEAVYCSTCIDTTQAIADLKKQLSQNHSVIPEKAILTTVEVVNGMVDIPVEPEKSRPYEQMLELLRWEIDPFLSELNEVTTIGSVLQSRGYINSQQRDQISLEMEITSEQGKRDRFGEIAMQLELINRDALDECLGLQEHLVSHDDQIACGWQGNSLKNDEGELIHYWNATGIGKHRRNHWMHSFQENGIQLLHLLPLSGASARLLDCKYSVGGRHLLVIEVFQEQLFCYRMKEGKVISIRTERRIDQQLTESIFVSLCYDQLRSDIDVIDIVSDESIDDFIIQQVEEQLQRKVRITQSQDVIELVTELDSTITPQLRYLPWLSGAAANGMDKKQLLYILPKVLPTDPLPPIWKRVDTWRYGIPIVLVIAIILFDASQRIYLQHLKQEKAKLELEYTKAGKLSKQVSALSSQSTSVKNKYETMQKELTDLKKKYELLDKKIYDRIKNLPNLLRNIAASVNSNIVLNSIDEFANKEGIRITGSTLTSQDAHRFVQRLNRVIKKDNELVVDDVLVEKSSKRLGNESFSFNLWLVPKKSLLKIKEKNKQQIASK